MRLHACLVFGFGCGRIAFDPLQDGGGGQGELACSPWSDPVEVAALTTEDDDYEPALSPDGSRLVFVRASATHVLYAATRAGPTFAAPAPIAALAIGGTGPTWAPTGDQLLFVSDGSGTLQTSDYVGNMFQAPVEVAELANVQITAPTVSGDGRELYYTDETGAAARISRATRTDAGTPWMLAGSEAELELADDGSGWASVSQDSLTIYFEGKLMREPRIWRATRGSTAERFSAPTRIEELASVPDLVAAGDPELSRDGTMLLFSMDRASTTTGFDIFVSTRTCP